MLKLLKEELYKHNVFSGEFPEYVDILYKTITSNLPDKMKLTLVISELMLFTSQLRRNILLWDNALIPTNFITFCIAESGIGKDKTIKTLRTCFKEGYDLIEKYRQDKAIAIAISQAIKNKIPDPEDNYMDYYYPPNPLFVAPSTGEGFIQHLNEIESTSIGAGFMTSSEFGAELISSPVIIECLKIISEVYDTGNKEVKMLKAKEFQSKPIYNLPVSALFIGSQDNLLYDDNIKRIFKREFTSKLARRSFFNYNPEPLVLDSYDDISKFISDELALEDTARENKIITNKLTKEIVKYHTKKSNLNKPLIINRKVRELFAVYKRYNYELANQLDPLYKISKISRQHYQWKALKLSGSFAIFERSDEIQLHHFIQAINYVELLSEDLQLFEQELSKESYEVFADYMYKQSSNKIISMSLHEIRKANFISSSGNIDNKIKDLLQLANTYTDKGVFYLTEDNSKVTFSPFIKSNDIGVSFIPVEGTKKERAIQANNRYTYTKCKFEDLEELLQDNYAYSMFEFKNGIRRKENVIPTTKWLALDIDKSYIKDTDYHLLLEHINHIIVRTSDKSNAYKFRLIVELDTEITITNNYWKKFIQSISNYLGITVDLLPQSQIFFSYRNRNILTTFNSKPLSVKEHIINAHKEKQKITEIKTSKQKQTLLNNPYSTFAFAFEAKNGEGSLALIKACHYAKKVLNADKEYIYNLVNMINNDWDKPMNQNRLQKTILSQVDSWF